MWKKYTSSCKSNYDTAKQYMTVFKFQIKEIHFYTIIFKLQIDNEKNKLS